MLFVKGESGNPAGRPKGRADRRTLYREHLSPHSPELIKKAIEMALDGNEPIMRELLSKILPTKALLDSIEIDLKNDTKKDIQKVYDLLAEGEITSQEFLLLLNSINVSEEIKSKTDVLPLLEKLKEKMLSEK